MLKAAPAEIVLISDPRVLQVSIQECGEEMVDLRKFTKNIHISDKHSDNNPYLHHVRKGVAERLKQAAALLPQGMQFLLTEGFRPIAVQKLIFESYSQKLQALYPDWSLDKIHLEATKYVAPPDIVPPHSTGGAIDLTILDSQGQQLDMGTEVDTKPHKCENRTYTHSPKISATARANRDLLIKVMSAVGFANYATEWWHWSYGDRYWAYQTQQAHAIYYSIHL